jgi:hypothetical protein
VASPAVYTCCLTTKAARRSEAEMTAMMTAYVSCGRVSKAFLAILEPESRGHSRENRLLETATQVRCMCFYAPIGP